MDPSHLSVRTAALPAGSALTLWLLVALGAAAQPQSPPQLPPAVTPGGAQPFLGSPSLPSIEAEDAFEIPPLAERPLGLDAGPRVRVDWFRMEGVQPRLEQGIRLAEIEALLARHLEAQPPEGFTVNQLQAVADDVTLYYRSRGLILAQAFVPAQEVRNGVVVLELLEGTLGSIEVEGNALYDSDVVRLPFTRLVGEPINEASIEEALLTLQEFPGLTVFGTFREGVELGETELLVRVREENRTTFTPRADNYGSEFTGQGRVAVRFEVNNPFGPAADRIGGYVLRTVQPSNGTYGGVEYSRRIGDRARGSIGLSLSRNTFDVTDASANLDLDIRGIVDQLEVNWKQSHVHRRTFRAGGTLSAAYKKAVSKLPGRDSQDELASLSYTYDVYSVGRNRRGMNLGWLRFTAGDNGGDEVGRVGGSGRTSEGVFSKLSFSYQRLQRFADHHALLLRLDGQHSNDRLASLEQYAIGGPANVRAYPLSEALVDTGGSASLEWIVDAPGFADRPIGNTTWGQVFQFSLYLDYAGGEINDPFPLQQRSVSLRGHGIGLQFRIAGHASLRVDIAKPDTAAPSNGRDPQTYVSFDMTF